MPETSHVSRPACPAPTLAADAAATPERRRRSFAARLLLGAIRGYQRLLSPVLPALFGPACGCRFAPTCSHYAAEAVRLHGASCGAWLALRRLLKCTPLHRGGFDPVPRSVRRCTKVRPERADTWARSAPKIPVS